VQSPKLSVSPKSVVLATVAFILAVRLFTLGFPDLVDTTEGRYAGVAQIMLERDDWVTPWIHYEGVNQPYLGKPPLHFWLVQTSFLLFGQNNFAARLPGVISAFGIGAALWLGAVPVLGAQATLVAIAAFASCCMTFFLSGAVLLDVTLTLGITIALISLLHVERSKLAGYLIFAGAALGVLTKGPLACILIGCVAVPWVVLHRLLTKRWPPHLGKVPWVPGIVLFLALVTPWYIWAEIRNPGFLEYFLWNENLGRYFSKDYVDEYGSGHRQPFGAGFLMMLLAVFPWSFLLIGVLIPRAKQIFSRQTLATLGTDSTLLFAICWALSCPVLLLGATQYTATYLMPSVPGFAFLIGVLWSRHQATNGVDRADNVVLSASETTVRKTLIIATALILFAWMVISVISLWFMSSAFTVAASLALALWVAGSFLLFVRSPRYVGNGRSGQLLGMLVLLSLVTSLAYGAATLCMNNYLSANRSSRRALEIARQLTPAGSPLRVGFPFYFPFSAWFYKPLTLEPQDKVLEVKQGDLAGAPADLLIVRKRNMERLRKELPNAREIGSVGQWRLIKLEQTLHE
jgi:4-amino-4-deoxy-L-arabinose transferase-like glycosyltransferase